MSDNEYKYMFELIVSQARVLDIVPMERMLETVNRAESVGPVLCPSEFIQGAKNLPPQREILEAAITFRNAVRKHTWPAAAGERA